MIQKILSTGRHAGFRRYFKNTAWMMAEQILRIIVGLFVGIWVARYLGPEQFGVFSYAFSFTAIFGGIAKFGLDAILVRELVNHPEQRDILLGTAFWLKMLGAVIVIGLLTAVILFTSNDVTTNRYIYIITIGFFFQSFEVVNSYFQSQVQLKFISFCRIVQVIVSSLLKIYLILEKASLLLFVLMITFDMASLGISYISSYLIKEKEIVFCKKFDFNVAVYLLHDSWPLIFSSFFAMVYLRIDQIMIKEMLDFNQLGIYSIVVKITEGFYFFSAIISESLFPAIINAKKSSEKIYLQRLQALYALVVWIGIIISVLVFFAGDNIILICFGGNYQAAGQVLKIHIWANVFIFLSAAFGKYLILEKLSMLNFYRVCIGALINILLNYFLIPVYGIIGASFSTLISLFIVNIAFDIFNKSLKIQLKMKFNSLFYPFYLLNAMRRKND